MRLPFGRQRLRSEICRVLSRIDSLRLPSSTSADHGGPALSLRPCRSAPTVLVRHRRSASPFFMVDGATAPRDPATIAHVAGTVRLRRHRSSPRPPSSSSRSPAHWLGAISSAGRCSEGWIVLSLALYVVHRPVLAAGRLLSRSALRNLAAPGRRKTTTLPQAYYRLYPRSGSLAAFRPSSRHAAIFWLMLTKPAINAVLLGSSRASATASRRAARPWRC